MTVSEVVAILSRIAERSPDKIFRAYDEDGEVLYLPFVHNRHGTGPFTVSDEFCDLSILNADGPTS